MKKCKVCGKKKPDGDFYGRRTTCKRCYLDAVHVYQADYYQRDDVMKWRAKYWKIYEQRIKEQKV